MPQSQSIESIAVGEVLDKVRALHTRGFRLVQISAVRLPDQIELTYSFDLNHELTSLRFLISAIEARVPSITGVFGCAALYENEVHDLFGIQVDGLSLDFHGNFYRTAVKFPFATPKPPPVKPAQAPATKPAAAEGS